MSSKTRLILDFGPLLAFFLAYRLAGLLTATAVLIPCTLMSLAIIYAKEKRIATMPLASAIIVTLLGLLTLYLHDETYIKMKTTLVNLLFAAILLGGFLFEKPMLKYLLSDALSISDEGWQKLSLRWGVFFIVIALLNEIVRRNFTTDSWVMFKIIDVALTMGFTFCQIPLIKKYWLEAEPDSP